MGDTGLTVRHVRLLLTLLDGPLHGYGMSARIERETEGAISLRPGSLYRAIHQLVQRGLIEEALDVEDDPRRRTYDLTDAGRAALSDELALLQDLVSRGRHLGAIKAES